MQTARNEIIAINMQRHLTPPGSGRCIHHLLLPCRGNYVITMRTIDLLTNFLCISVLRPLNAVSLLDPCLWSYKTILWNLNYSHSSITVKIANRHDVNWTPNFFLKSPRVQRRSYSITRTWMKQRIGVEAWTFWTEGVLQKLQKSVIY